MLNYCYFCFLTTLLLYSYSMLDRGGLNRSNSMDCWCRICTGHMTRLSHCPTKSIITYRVSGVCGWHFKWMGQHD